MPGSISVGGAHTHTSAPSLVNKPERVVVGRYLKRRWAMGAHQVLNVVGQFGFDLATPQLARSGLMAIDGTGGFLWRVEKGGFVYDGPAPLTV